MTAKSNAREGDGVAIKRFEPRIGEYPGNHFEDAEAEMYEVSDGDYIRYSDHLTAMQAQQGAEPVAWQPIETAPDGELVMVFTPDSGDGDRVDFDCREDGLWLNHDDAYEHYMAVGGPNAGGSDCVCVGPAQEAPYTHWQPYPTAPATGAPR